MTAKHLILDVLQRIPDTASLEQIPDSVVVMIANEEGMKYVRAGRIHCNKYLE